MYLARTFLGGAADWVGTKNRPPLVLGAHLQRLAAYEDQQHCHGRCGKALRTHRWQRSFGRSNTTPVVEEEEWSAEEEVIHILFYGGSTRFSFKDLIWLPRTNAAPASDTSVITSFER